MTSPTNNNSNNNTTFNPLASLTPEQLHQFHLTQVANARAFVQNKVNHMSINPRVQSRIDGVHCNIDHALNSEVPPTILTRAAITFRYNDVGRQNGGINFTSDNPTVQIRTMNPFPNLPMPSIDPPVEGRSRRGAFSGQGGGEGEGHGDGERGDEQGSTNGGNSESST